jgi:hypothetical protein
MRKKLRRIKRLVFVGAIVGAVFALRRAKAARDARNVLGPPASWPPLQPAEPPVGALGDLAAEPSAAEPPAADVAATVPSDDPVAAAGEIATEEPGAAWIAPDQDGSCPTSHPVKANGNSGIYHLPGGPHYGRTRAERCYVDAAAAEADGYRAAKSS